MGVTQSQGVIFEEVVAKLLQGVGYQRIERSSRKDKAVTFQKSVAYVEGRGARHQVDVLLNFPFSPSFTFPMRLYVEAKCYQTTRKIPLHVVRNAVGTLKDIQEYWTKQDAKKRASKRVSYCYTLFSTTDFSDEAIEYGYSQGIFLVWIDKIPFLGPLFDIIRYHAEAAAAAGLADSDLRRIVRAGTIDDVFFGNFLTDRTAGNLSKEVSRLRFMAVGMLNGEVPIGFFPSNIESLSEHPNDSRVRVRIEGADWFLESENWRPDQRLYFSFPERLFNRTGFPSQGELLDLKSAWFKEVNFLHFMGESPTALRLLLDDSWIFEKKAELQARQAQSIKRPIYEKDVAPED